MQKTVTDYSLRVTLERFSEPCILFILSEGESYGYNLFDRLKNSYKCKVNSGGLYRTLMRMEKAGLIKFNSQESNVGPTKKVYQITITGKLALDAWISRLEDQQRIIAQFISRYKMKQLKDGIPVSGSTI